MPIPEEQLIIDIYNKKAKDDENTKTLAHTLQSVVLDTLSGEKYLNELMQNADDAKSPIIEFVLVGSYLIFKHSGRHFDEEDIIGICDAADPNRKKTRDLEQIGNKGIGFKAVFTMASTVYIYSQNYQFCFNEHHSSWKNNSKDYPWQIIPIATAQADFPAEAKPYLEPEKVNFVFRVRPELQKSIEEHLKKLTSRHLLFLRVTKQLSFTIKKERAEDEVQRIKLETPRLIQLSPSAGNPPADFQVAEHKLHEKYSWWTYEKNCPLSEVLKQKLITATDKDIPEKYKSATHLPVTLAVPVIEGKLVSIDSGATVFCYLPTELNLGIKFLVNAEFLLDTARMHPRGDLFADAWNDFLIEAIFVAQVSFLSFLAREDRTFALQIFNLFAEPNKVPERIKKSCGAAFKDMVARTYLVRNLPFGSTDIISSRIIDDHQFIQSFGNEALQKTCAHPEIIQRDLLKKYGAKSFGIDQIIATFKEPWLLTLIQTPEKNKEFFKYMANLYAETDSATEKEKLKKALQNNALILSAHSTLQSPSKIYFPEATLLYLTAEFNFLNILHEELNAIDSETKEFFTRLGVRNLSLDNVIKMANDAPQELLAFTLKVIDKWPALDEKTRQKFKALKLQTKNDKFAEATQCHLPNSHAPSHQLEDFIQGGGFLISENYPGENGRAFLLEMGVGERLRDLEQFFQIINAEACAAKIIAFTRWIFSLDDTPGSVSMHLTKLKVVDQNNQLQLSTNCYLPDCYAPAEPLQKHGVPIPYLSSRYHAGLEARFNDLKKFFLAIGVNNRIKIASHNGKLRNDLVDIDPAAREYFDNLESITPELFPEVTRRYMYQHHISYYMQISYAEHIFSFPLFWQILSREWSSVEKGIQQVMYHTHRSEKSTISNIHYWVQRAVQSAYGEKQSPANFYGNQVKLILGDEFSANLNIATITGELSFEQLTTLGFKEHLTLADCQHVLTAIATAHNPQNDWPKIIFIYEQLLAYINNFNEPLENLSLLNEANQFVSNQSLCYVMDNLLPHTMNSSLIKKPAAISEDAFQKLCRLCAVELVSFADITITPQVEVPSDTLKNKIAERLNYLVSLYGHKQDWTGAELLTHGGALWHAMNKKLAKLQCYSAETFTASYDNIRFNKVAKEIDLWIDKANAIIYHCPLESLDSNTSSLIYKFLLTYFSFNIAEEDFNSIMSLPMGRIIRKYPILSSEHTEDFSQTQTTPLPAMAPEKKNLDEVPEISVSPAALIHEACTTVEESSVMPVEQNTAMQVIPLSRKRGPEPDSETSILPPSKKMASDFNAAISSWSVASLPISNPARFRQSLFTLTREQRTQIGLSGEESVYNYLRKKHSDKYGSAAIIDNDEGYTIQMPNGTKTIKWMNKMQESYAPYDFEIKIVKGEVQKTRYLEVKTTTTKAETIEVNYSVGEWETMHNAEKTQTSYRLYLVGLNGEEEPMIRKHYPMQEIEKGTVTATDFKRLAFPKFN